MNLGDLGLFLTIISFFLSPVGVAIGLLRTMAGDSFHAWRPRTSKLKAAVDQSLLTEQVQRISFNFKEDERRKIVPLPYKIENTRKHIEELREELLGSLHVAWQSVFQYGYFKIAEDPLHRFSEEDQKRILCMALILGPWHIRRVAEKIIERRGEEWKDCSRMMSTMNEKDRAELESIQRSLGVNSIASESDEMDIKEELAFAHSQMSRLQHEETVWIFIPFERAETIIWVPTNMAGDDQLKRVRFGDAAWENLNKGQEYELLTKVRQSKWTLHLHNHPVSGIPLPSPADLSTSTSWKNLRPELKPKMKFFIVGKDSVAEYGLTSGEPKLYLSGLN
jgi:hypothetical protein